MRIAVAGGTGTVGRYVVEAAHGAGHEAIALSRRTGIDLYSGVGLAGALEGVDVVVDATSPSSLRRDKATGFFVTVTRHLQAAGAAAVLSIVGIDRVPGNGYYEAKIAQEQAALEGPVPARIVRATQFHEFPAQILTRSRLGPVAAMPVMRVRPVAARAVGEVLVEVAGSSDGGMLEVAGPEAADLVDLARAVVKRQGRRAAVVPVRIPGSVGRAMRGGALLPGDGARIVGPAFSEWLAGDDVDAVTTMGRPPPSASRP
jgi:uncharacterized protein YbjT (DUF2867 family)